MTVDTLTVATAKPTVLLTKQWRRGRNGELVSTEYDKAAYFKFRSEPVTGIRDLARVLDTIAADPHSAVIRAEPRIVDRWCLRRLKDGVYRGEAAAATVDPHPRRWVLLDFDTAPPPAGADRLTDPEDLIRHAVSWLPPAFAGAACWWSFTSGMWIKPGLRLRLGFWLNRPLSGAELKVWLRDAPLDRSVFNDLQLIYVAAPVFDDPSDDPFLGTRRSGFLDGGRDFVEAPPPANLQEVARAERETAKARSRAAAGGSWQDALALVGDGDGREGFYAPIKLTIGRFFHENGSKADAAPLRAALVEAIRKAPLDKASRDDEYPVRRIADLDTWIKWTRDRQAKSEAPEASQLKNAERRWTSEKLTLAKASDLLDTWVMTWFWFNHLPAKEVRQRQAEQDIAVNQWRERQARWESLRDFSSEADVFANTFSEAPPARARGFERAALRVAAGVGKTTTVIRELSYRILQKNERAYYAVPNHAKCAEVSADFAKHGVTAKVWQGFGFPREDPSCRRAEEVRQHIAAGGSLFEMCRDCPFHPKKGGDCAYQAQRAERPDVWVVPHAALQFEPRALDRTFDWGVIDEAYSLSAEKTTIHVDELCSLEDGRLRNSPAYERAIERLRAVLRARPIGPLRQDQFDAFTADECRSLARSAMIDHVSPLDVDGSLRDACAVQNSRVDRRRLFWSILASFIDEGHPASGRLCWTGSECVMHAPRPIAKGWLQSHVLAIDATLDERVVQRWLPGAQLWTEIDVENTGRVRFVRSPPVSFNKIVPGSTVPSALRTQENNLRRLWQRVEAEAGLYAAVGEEVLLVLPKGAEDWIRKEYVGRIPRNLHIDHFGNLRGINTYECVAKAFIVSRTQPTSGEVARLSAALFDRPFAPLPSDYLPQRPRFLRTRDGGAESVQVDCHPDTDVQALLEQVREAEVEQAAHRVRPVRRRCEIDLVSIVPVNLTVDEVLNFHEWLSEMDVVSLAVARGVVPETTTQFARVVSDVCADRKALEHHFRREPAARSHFEAAVAAANAVKTPIIDSLYRRFHRIRAAPSDFRGLPPWRQFRVRAADHRKRFVVWIDSAAQDPREVAQTYFGELLEWTALTAQ